MVTVEKRLLGDGSLHVSVAGEIGDTFDVTPIVQAAKGDKVVIHLGEVHSLTSVGVRNFEELVNGFGKREVVLIHISPAIAMQVVMIPGLTGAARVESAKLPFLCPQCAAEAQHSIPWKARSHLEHAPKCGKCGATMELDGIPEQYLP
jgi:hypothetical protein